MTVKRWVLWGLLLALGLGLGIRSLVADPVEPAALPTLLSLPQVTAGEEVERVSDAQALALSGADFAVLSLKEDSGALAFVSKLPLALDAGASFWDPGENLVLSQGVSACQGDAVAMVSCFRDDLLSNARPDLTLRRVSGAPWRDEEGFLWLDPENPEVQSYLIALCREIAQLGFDEIVLTNLCYPTGEDLRLPQDPTLSLETFSRKLAGALADLPVRLSVKAQGDCLEPDAPSGQSAALLAVFPGRVWAEQEDREALDPLSPLLLPQKEDR